MERLTVHRDSPLVMSMWGGDSESLKVYNRLAAYEDTELAPQEIKATLHNANEMYENVAKRYNDLTHEYMTAESERNVLQKALNEINNKAVSFQEDGPHSEEAALQRVFEIYELSKIEEESQK